MRATAIPKDLAQAMAKLETEAYMVGVGVGVGVHGRCRRKGAWDKGAFHSANGLLHCD